MTARLAAVTRLIRRLLAVLALALLALMVAAGVAVYLTATGRSLPLLRAVTAKVGTLIAGQQTERLTLDLHVAPTDAHLAGSATLTVRSTEAARQRFYFLLNNGLRIRSLHASGIDPAAHAPAVYQLSMLTIVDLGHALAKDATVDLTFDYDGSIGGGMFDAASSLVNPQQVMLNTDSFWYPNDVQSCFTADVTVTLPTSMTLVHNGTNAVRVQRGDLQQVHWRSDRPVGGLSLVAGPYRLTTVTVDGTPYRLYLPDDIDVDAKHILKLMADANDILSKRYGPSGFTQLTLFVSRELRRGYNDGSGLIGLSIRYLRSGDYGFGTIAHEIAHNWWGATVAEKWLSPGSGGEWIVEGFAEFSSLVATEAEYGNGALTRRLHSEFFDPKLQAIISDMSVLDNALAEATARDTIYRKGAYVAFMLRHVLGDDVYFTGLRQFIERFRYQHVTDHDLQQVLQESSGTDLQPYFADWVRAARLADLSLDANGQGEISINNLGTAAIAGDIDLWTFAKGGGAPTRRTVHVGDQLSLPADAEYAVLDPLLAWADVQRENNRYPRRSDPVAVSTSAHGELAIAAGEPFPWVRTALSTIASDGHTLHTWDFERGLADAPLWSPDGARLIASYTDGDGPLPAVVALAADGTRKMLGRGKAPAIMADGSIIAASQDRLVKLNGDGRDSTIVQRPGEALDQPQPSPDGKALAYTAGRGNHFELRTTGIDGRGDRQVLSWDRDRFVYRWAADGTQLFAIIGGNWDWQIWQIPLSGEAVRVLASGAAAISDLAVSPDATQLAFTAAPALDYPTNRRQLYILNLKDHNVRSIDVPDTDLSQLTWSGGDTLLVVATPAGGDTPWFFPAPSSLKRVHVGDGTVEEFK
ncbi:MAG: M1 family aminopeptidase [Candidatus Binatia bacterium]